MQITLFDLPPGRIEWLVEKYPTLPTHPDAIVLVPDLVLRVELVLGDGPAGPGLRIHVPPERQGDLETHRSLIQRLLEHLLVLRPAWRKRLGLSEAPFYRPRFLLGPDALPDRIGAKLMAMSHYSLDYLARYTSRLTNLTTRNALDVAYQLAKIVGEPCEVERAAAEAIPEHTLLREDTHIQGGYKV